MRWLVKLFVVVVEGSSQFPRSPFCGSSFSATRGRVRSGRILASQPFAPSGCGHADVSVVQSPTPLTLAPLGWSRTDVILHRRRDH
jgi:hypothetical protein